MTVFQDIPTPSTPVLSPRRAIKTCLIGFAYLILSACGGGDSPAGENNAAPSVSITSPADGLVASAGENITFSATASDAEDGDLSNQVEWFSDIDGNIGSGSSLTVLLSVGEHRITARVADSAQSAATDMLDMSIQASDGIALVSWTAPSLNTDLTDLEDLVGFKVYYGESSDDLDQSITINNPDTYLQLVENLRSSTTYYFAVTAINSKGIESAFSNITSKFIGG